VKASASYLIAYLALRFMYLKRTFPVVQEITLAEAGLWFRVRDWLLLHPQNQILKIQLIVAASEI
jgi:hypothetical protein